ncbi:M23 family metallopeptidase [bacterium]|nr:M23 family metallopeptidase [bacterium]
MLYKKSLALLSASVLFGSLLGYLILSTTESGDSFQEAASTTELAQKNIVDLPVIPLEEEFPHVIPPKSSLFQVLRELEIDPSVIHSIVEASKPVHNLARLHPGIRFQLKHDTLSGSQLVQIQFRLSALEKLTIKREHTDWVAQKFIEKVDIQVVHFSGTVTSSLWESAVKSGMDPDLISELADIFGWEVDFAREVQVNDRWRLSVEQKKVKGQPVGWGAILAAEYINVGEAHRAALFRLDGEDRGYFTPEGQSLRKVFLKSPIRYGRITSGFKRRRFHPVLQVYRAHQGVDYGAPTGTPVRSVGDGTVIFAARSGGGGNVIKIRHNATYQTAYKHLHGYARGVRNGARVKQGQVIGYVGSTGLSTGPHLHFEFYQSGRYIDPLGKKFPSADPVPSEHMVFFKSSAQQLLKTLPDWTSSTSSADVNQRLPSAM